MQEVKRLDAGLTPMLTHVRKIFSCKVSFKCPCQRVLNMLRKNFEHGCDQVLSE